MRREKSVRPGHFLATLLVPLLAGCATNPATGEPMLSLISESREIEMGREYAQQIDASMPEVDDPELQRYVEEIGLSLAATSERPTLPWSFSVLDDPSVNAFALPGGFIYVTRGILTHFNSEAEMAAVLGHEIGHVTARHSVEQMSRQQLLGGLLGIGAVLSEDVADLAGLGQAAIGIFSLSHSRSDEHQADALGVRYALRDDYDPREAVDVHRMLQRQTEARGGRGIPNWLATHPSSADRIDRIRSQLDTIADSRLAGTRVLVDPYMERIDGLVYGVDPRQGFFQGSLFLHPDLEFQLRLPDGWSKANLARAVVAQSPGEDAIVELSLSSTQGHAAAANAFFDQEGLRSRGVSRTTVNGLPATTGSFEARTQDRVLAGTATFLDYEGRTYRILGYTLAQRLGTYEGAFRAVTSSFDRLTDPAALGVEPMRIQVITVQRETTLRDMTASRQGPISPDELALLNGVELGETLEPGRKLKWVVGRPPPTGS